MRCISSAGLCIEQWARLLYHRIWCNSLTLFYHKTRSHRKYRIQIHIYYGFGANSEKKERRKPDPKQKRRISRSSCTSSILPWFVIRLLLYHNVNFHWKNTQRLHIISRIFASNIQSPFGESAMRRSLLDARSFQFIRIKWSNSSEYWVCACGCTL